MKRTPIICAVVIAGMIELCRTGVIPSRSRPRLSVVDWNNYNFREPQGPGTYAFGYDIEDPTTNNVQFRNEERHPNGTVTGSYGYVGPDGVVRIVNYVADHRGYRATEETDMKLTMLKPIRYPDTPFFIPELAWQQSSGQVHDQRTRPSDQLDTRIVTLPNNFQLFNQFNSNPEIDLYEPSRFDFFPTVQPIYFPSSDQLQQAYPAY